MTSGLQFPAVGMRGAWVAASDLAAGMTEAARMAEEGVGRIISISVDEQGTRVAIQSEALFRASKDQLKPFADDLLGPVIGLLTQNHRVITVGAHTDDVGPRDENVALSRRRAENSGPIPRREGYRPPSADGRRTRTGRTPRWQRLARRPRAQQARGDRGVRGTGSVGRQRAVMSSLADAVVHLLWRF